ncbi:MAG: xanthine dehydrogenase family protein, partial [Firmicutes bacterium]|nr:xanthine dehydrogenase family protein [Bacillota bacterium]
MPSVGKSVVRFDAAEKAQGKTRYLDDQVFPGLLYGRVIRSPFPHAAIESISVDRAREVPGLHAILTSADLPRTRFGPYVKDTPLLAEGIVRYVGEPVALAAASSEEAAASAAALIDIRYRELPPILDPRKAGLEASALVHEDVTAYESVLPRKPEGNVCAAVRLEQGDVEDGFRKSYRVYEHEFETSAVSHCSLEPHVAVAQMDDRGILTIRASTQSLAKFQARVAEALNLPMHRVRIISPPLGGGFGAKLEPTAALYGAALALVTGGRPVKVANTMQDEIRFGRPRLKATIRIKTGVDRDGHLLARKADLIYDTGAYADEGPGATFAGSARAIGPYRVPNYLITGRCVYTNNYNAGAFRGYGVPQSAFASESQMDIIARDLGIDPLELRLRNAMGERDVPIGGRPLSGYSLRECLRAAAARADWNRVRDARRGDCPPRGSVPQNGSVPARGVGLACIQSITGMMNAEASVRLNEDGTVQVAVGTMEIGTGSETVLAQIAAETLGLPLDAVRMVTGDTEQVPYNYGMAASRTTFVVGNAVWKAASKVAGMVKAVAADLLKASPADLILREGRVTVDGMPEKSIPVAKVAKVASKVNLTPISAQDNYIVEGRAGYAAGACMAEVEVDPETGGIEVLRLVAAHDLGRAVNPLLAEGQIHGAVSQGLGYALTEQLIFCRGEVLNGELHDYRIPTAVDLPK